MNSKNIIIVIALILIFSIIIYRIVKDKKNGSVCSSCSCMDFQIELEKIKRDLNK